MRKGGFFFIVYLIFFFLFFGINMPFCFYQSGTSMKCVSSSGMQLGHVQHVHSEVCSLLLNSYEALRTTIAQYLKLLPPWQRQELKTSGDFQYLHNLDYPGKVNWKSLSFGGLEAALCTVIDSSIFFAGEN